MKKKGKVGSDAVLGKYLRLMKINQFSKYTYADTEKLQFETNKNLQQVAARLAVNDANASAEFLELQKQLDNGEISQAQFDTLNPLSRIADEQPEYLEFAESSAIDEDEILAQLTDEEIKMLKLK